MSKLLTRLERKIMGSAFAISAGLIVLAFGELITFNDSPSAPNGFYLRVPRALAPTYITFCLTDDHRGTTYYSQACSSDRPNHTRILKYVQKVHPDHGYWVISVHPNAIDSKLIGWITPGQIKGHWRTLITWKAAQPLHKPSISAQTPSLKSAQRAPTNMEQILPATKGALPR